MTKYSRTVSRPPAPFWRNALRTAAALAALSIVANSPAAAQNRRSNSNTAGAALHVTAVIVPSVMPPLAASSPSQGAITYNVPLRQMPLSVTTQTQPFHEGVVLKTMTVVSK
jgi:hypothetical protein